MEEGTNTRRAKSEVTEGDHIIIYIAALLFSIGLFVTGAGIFFNLGNIIKIGGALMIIGIGIRAGK